MGNRGSRVRCGEACPLTGPPPSRRSGKSSSSFLKRNGSFRPRNGKQPRSLRGRDIPRAEDCAGPPEAWSRWRPVGSARPRQEMSSYSTVPTPVGVNGVPVASESVPPGRQLTNCCPLVCHAPGGSLNRLGDNPSFPVRQTMCPWCDIRDLKPDANVGAPACTQPSPPRDFPKPGQSCSNVLVAAAAPPECL